MYSVYALLTSLAYVTSCYLADGGKHQSYKSYTYTVYT